MQGGLVCNVALLEGLGVIEGFASVDEGRGGGVDAGVVLGEKGFNVSDGLGRVDLQRVC